MHDCQHDSLAYTHPVADSYTWRDMRDDGSYRLPGPDHLGWWAAAAMIVSVLLHVILFFALDHVQIALGIKAPEDTQTGTVEVRQVVEAEPLQLEPLTPEDIIVPPAETSALLEEIDILEQLPKDQELDILPELVEPEFAIRMANPAQEGEPEALAIEAATGFEIDADLPELGRMETDLPAAAVGQVTVDPGAVQADDLDLTKFTEDLLKAGANGKVDKGALDGITSLDELLGLPENVLIGKTTMLPSDLLFEFNSHELRESAKVGLMKLGLLMDLNPGLHCWIEGHADLVGGDQFNLDLSRKRAEAVESYLVKSMAMDDSRIHPRGFGRFKPLVPGGSVDEQAPNRRVEIRMRKTPPPPGDPIKVTPAPTAPPAAETPPPKAMIVSPGRAIPVEDPNNPVPPKAAPVLEEPTFPELPTPPRATPVEPDAPPAAVPRAEPVQE
jgi:outer membrane protein OmpA-like peptidoglycan-associated protein